MPDKLTDKEIFGIEIKCINRRANGQCNGGTDCCNCDLLMNEKDIISAYERAITNLDLINRQEQENESLKDILYDAEGVNLVNYWHQQCKIAENGCKNFSEENKNLKAENERLSKENIALNRRAIPSSGHILKVGNALLFAEKQEDYNTTINHIKAEAYKEAFEKIRDKQFLGELDLRGVFYLVTSEDIDEVEKELVGG